MRVQVVAPGEAGHGVVRHARLVGALLEQHGAQQVSQRPDAVHVHFTDALWGADIATAAAAFARWSRSQAAPVVVGLHDVPGIDPDPARDVRRADGYRRVVAAADAVIVSDVREADDVARLTGVRAHVVPLPLPPLAPPADVPSWADRPSVVVLGFVYPGKGHDRAVAAAAGTGARVVALGGPSPGSTGLLDALRRDADARGVELVITGPVDDATLHAGMRAATVPVAAYRTLGASGSVAAWRAAGRRPLCLPSAHVRELERVHPQAVAVVPDDGLTQAVRAALRAPAPTWSGAGAHVDVGALTLAVLAGAAGWRAAA